MDFAQLHKADGLLKEAFETFHKVVTGDSFHNEFLNWYEYIEDKPKEIESWDGVRHLRKESVFSPCDMEDPMRLDCYGFLSEKMKKQIRYNLRDIEIEDVVPKQKEMLLEKYGMHIPESVRTCNELDTFIDRNKKLFGDDYDDMQEELLDVYHDQMGMASETCYYNLAIDIDALDAEEALLVIRMADGSLDRAHLAVIYEGRPFHPDNPEEKQRTLEAFKEWVDEQYCATPWLESSPSP